MINIKRLILSLHMSPKADTRYILKTSLLFCGISTTFSLVGLLLPDNGPLPSPIGGFNIHEIVGHILWGLLAGASFLGIRYVIITGLFAVLIDSDHLIALIPVNAIPRMSHSIVFSAIAVTVLMTLTGRKDYKLGAAAVSGILAHISFDTFAGYGGRFPLFTPFYNHSITFPNTDWIYFEIGAAVVTSIITILAARNRKIKVPN